MSESFRSILQERGGIRSVVLVLLIIGISALPGFGQWTEPRMLEGAINNDPSIMTWPSISADGNTLYYSTEGAWQEDIYFSYRVANGSWSVPHRIDSVNDEQRQLSPAIGPGDSVLYFVSYGREGGYGDYDIWYSRRAANGLWMQPENAGPSINTSGMEWSVCISRSGQSLYFSRSTTNALDIFKSTWDGAGWGPAEPLPGHVNTWRDEEHVTLPADESFLILTWVRFAASLRDLFVSDFDGTEWGEPVGLDQLNYARHESGASLTPDGDTLYFASMRNDSNPWNSRIYRTYRITPARERSGLRPDSEIKVFPNPLNGREFGLILPGILMQPWSLTICSSDGRRAWAAPGDQRSFDFGSRVMVKLPEMSSGKYWVTISSHELSNTIPLVILK